MKTLLMILLMAPSLSWAAPFVCFTGKGTAAVHDGGLQNAVYQGEPFYQLAKWNPSCQAIEKVETGLAATALVMSGAGFILACTGVGLPATLWLEGGALGVQTVGLIVGALPCDNSARDEEIKEMAELVVCEELAKQGIRCSFQL